MQQLEAEHAERTQRGYAIETELRENRDRISQIALEIDRAHARRRHNEERCAELLVRSASAEAELAQARHRLHGAGIGARMPTARFSNPLPPISPPRRAILRSASRTPPQPQPALAEIERQQEEARVAIFDTVSSASHLRNQLAQAEERLAGADREARRLEAEIATANTQVEAFGGQRGQLALEFESVTQRAAGISRRDQPTSAA